MSESKMRVIDVRDGDFFEIEITELITRIYETTKSLVEQRNILLSKIEEQLMSVEDAVAVMAVLYEGENLTSTSAVISGLLNEATEISRRIRSLNTTVDRFSAMKRLFSSTVIRVSLEQAYEYGF